jgi:hypothetical protein
MIDALDEIPATKGMEIIEKAKIYSQKIACPLIITSRKIDIIKNAPEGFEKYEILPFEYSQALQLFEKLVQDKNSLKCLKSGLEKIQFQIPKVPLSLILLIDLVEENKEIPASITELYDRFNDLMLGRWDREKGIKVIFDYIIKRKFLSELAYKEFFKKDRVENCKVYGWNTNESKEFLKEINRAGIISISDKVKFNHRSFLDYFVARYIYDQREELEDLNNIVVKIYFNDLWRDVTFFYIGLKREISKVTLEAILKFKENNLSSLIDKFLIGRLLQAGWNSKTRIKYIGVQESIKLIPKIREEIEKVINKEPLIYSDFFIMALGDFSFGSRFIFKESKLIFNQLSKELNEKSQFQMLVILWAIQELMTDIELKENVDNFLEALSDIPGLSIEAQARSLLLLTIIERRDNIMNKKIKDRVIKLYKKYPETFRKLLPYRKKGFRKK